MAKMTAIESFAEAVREFRRWATKPSEGAAGCREALTRLVALYAGALELPPPWNNSLSPESLDLGPDDKEVSGVITAISTNLPIHLYRLVYDPHAEPDEEPVAATLSDDIADIYRDVVGGLLLFDSGATAEALWNWGFSFQAHWGRHAVSAMSAIHCYLAAEAQDLLSHP